MARIDLDEAVATLAPLYPQADMPSDPLAQILWENIGYLIDDERRAVLFAEFEDRVGVTAQAILDAPGDVLLDIASRGGMNPAVRVERWRTIGALAGPDLTATLRSLPVTRARSLLKTFPVIGDPGADKILLFSGIAPRPSLESNGLRALVRLGYVADDANYGRVYKAGVAVLAAQSGEAAWLKSAYLVLRDHGRAVCKRAAPLCMACPLDAVCAHIQPIVR